MAKRKPKETELDTEQAAASAGAPVSESSAEMPPTESPAEHSSEAGEQKKWANAADPRGTHNIDLGDGRRLRLLRGNQFQQTAISFYSNDENVDPKPSPEDTQWLKDHGFTTYRPEIKARTKQLLTPEQKAEVDEVKEKHGDDAAARLRSKYRISGQLEAERDFLELANLIRQRNSLEPVSGITSEGRGA